MQKSRRKSSHKNSIKGSGIWDYNGDGRFAKLRIKGKDKKRFNRKNRRKMDKVLKEESEELVK